MLTVYKHIEASETHSHKPNKSVGSSAESCEPASAKAAGAKTAVQKLKSTFGQLVYVLASLVIVLAILSFATNMLLDDIVVWITQNFGLTFTVLFSVLMAVAGVSIIKVWLGKSLDFWGQVGAQTANGISTLALTFTLLGISLGIGALSGQSLTPDNVNDVISVLTDQFSIAFMTTVVGLPAATMVRAAIAIILAKHANTQAN